METSSKSSIIVAETFMVKVCHAMGLDPSKTARIVIDGKAGEVLRVYVEMYGVSELLDIEFPTGGVEVRILDGT